MNGASMPAQFTRDVKLVSGIGKKAPTTAVSKDRSVNHNVMRVDLTH